MQIKYYSVRNNNNHIGGVKVRVLALGGVDRWF